MTRERLPTCQEVVELITAYLEGSMPPHESERLEQHLVWCSACRNYVEQMRETARLLGEIPEETVGDDAREELARLFQDWRG